MQETLPPAFNVSYGVRTALSPDPTSLAPANRVLDLELAGCGRLDRIIGPLQGAGVTRVLSLDPLTHPSLRLLREVAPSRIEPLRIHIYDLADARPRFSQPVRVVRDLPNHLDLDVVADRPTRLEVLEPWAAGWSATVNGTEQPILRSADGHREIGLEAGPNRIRMAYEPPGLRKGLGLSLTSGAICLALLLSGWRRAGEKSGPDKRA